MLELGADTASVSNADYVGPLRQSRGLQRRRGGEASRPHRPPRRYQLVTESDHNGPVWAPSPGWVADTEEATLGPASPVASELPMSCPESSDSATAAVASRCESQRYLAQFSQRYLAGQAVPGLRCKGQPSSPAALSQP